MKPPPNVTIIALTRGYYASLTTDAQRRIDLASQSCDADNERSAALALAVELITIGGEILDHLCGPATGIEAKIDRLIKAADTRAARQIDAAACRTSHDFRRARAAEDDLDALRDATIADLRPRS